MPKITTDIEAIEEQPNIAADPVVQYMNKDQLQKLLDETQRKMKKASKEEDFMEAARLRDEMMELQKLVNSDK